jgi:hypothetical protein
MKSPAICGLDHARFSQTYRSTIRELRSKYHFTSVESRCDAVVADALATLCTRGFSSLVASTACSDCYRVERTSSRAGLTPAVDHRLSRRTRLSALSGVRA